MADGEACFLCIRINNFKNIIFQLCQFINMCVQIYFKMWRIKYREVLNDIAELKKKNFLKLKLLNNIYICNQMYYKHLIIQLKKTS